MKQIGLALQSYQSTYQYFPGVDTPSVYLRSGAASNHSYCPLARLLAELDQGPLYNAANLTDQATLPGSLWANLTVMSMSVSLFVCPSDIQPSVPGYGRVDYRFNVGPGPWDAPAPLKQAAWEGPFTTHRFYTPAAFTDGLSQTVGVSERLQGNWTKGVWTPGDYVLTGVGDSYMGHIPHLLTIDWAVSVCASASEDPPCRDASGRELVSVRIPFHRLQPLRPAERRDPRLLDLFLLGGDSLAAPCTRGSSQPAAVIPAA